MGAQPKRATPRVTDPAAVRRTRVAVPDATPAPRWVSTAGANGGRWGGRLTAFNPHTGEPEAVGFARGRELALDAVLDRSAVLEVADDKSQRLAESSLWALRFPDAVEPFEEFGDSVLKESEDGMVGWDDGCYTRGPVELGVSDAALAEYCAPPTAVMESVFIDVPTQKRCRVVVTLGWSDDPMGGDDMALEVLRVSLALEEWLGPVGTDLAESAFQDAVVTLGKSPLSEEKPLTQDAVAGEWHVLERTASVVEGDDGDPALAHAAGSVDETWGTPTEAPDDRAVNEGWAIWLPGGAWASLEFTPDGELLSRAGWVLPGGREQAQLVRVYDADGTFVEASSRTMCRPGGATGNTPAM